jgi:hypothetical protein
MPTRLPVKFKGEVVIKGQDLFISLLKELVPPRNQQLGSWQFATRIFEMHVSLIYSFPK